MNRSTTMVRWMLIAALAGPATAMAQSNMDALLEEVKEASERAAALNAQREQRFLNNRNEQAELLKQARRELGAARSRADKVKGLFDANQKALEDLRGDLKEAVGELGQMYAGIRQSAGDFRTVAEQSLVTSQYPKRLDFLTRLSKQKELPSIKQIETLWFALTQDLAAGGEVETYDAQTVDVFGSRSKITVTRVGPFAAFSDDRYLVPIDSGRNLQVLPRQPPGRYRDAAADFGDDAQVSPILIDPSLGTLLQLEGEKPTLSERVDQGGLVGYVILVLAAFGIVVALFQLLYLMLVRRRMSRQLADTQRPKEDNPLGRVLATFNTDQHATDEDPELLELRLSEAVLKETPRLQRFQPMLRLIAAVAPLLGLLGTVTGMIATFQAITVFGTGDPKLMAGGISQALVTTVMGLLTAIPILFVNSLLSSRSRAMVQILDEQSAGLLARSLEALEAQKRSV